jgi:hypothetical protein
VRTSDNNDRDLNNNEVININILKSFLVNISMKAYKLKSYFTEYVESLKEEMRLLSEQQDQLVQWDGLGPRVERDSLEPFTALTRHNMLRCKVLYLVTQELEIKLIGPLSIWSMNTEAAL